MKFLTPSLVGFTPLFILLLWPFTVAAQLSSERYTALVEQSEASGALPKPVLLQIVSEGVNLEQAASITVSTSVDAAYAEAYTYYAICMSINDTQAEAVHDVVIASARENLRANVLAEAHFALDHFLTNRCEGVERLTRVAPDDTNTTQNTAGGRASISL